MIAISLGVGGPDLILRVANSAVIAAPPHQEVPPMALSPSVASELLERFRAGERCRSGPCESVRLVMQELNETGPPRSSVPAVTNAARPGRHSGTARWRGCSLPRPGTSNSGSRGCGRARSSPVILERRRRIDQAGRCTTPDSVTCPWTPPTCIVRRTGPGGTVGGGQVTSMAVVVATAVTADVAGRSSAWMPATPNPELTTVLRRSRPDTCGRIKKTSAFVPRRDFGEVRCLN
jgi:hypothetical protein